MDTSLVFIIFEIAFFIILSGFFSGAETAITASSEAKILQLKIQGNKKAAILYDLKLNKEKLIGAILLANTGFNSLSSSIMAAETVKVFGNEAVIYASLVITVVILIFSEILPKSYVFRNPDNFALAIAPVIKVIVTICSPVTSVIQWMVSIVMRFVDDKKDSKVSATDAIRGAIELSHHQGDVVKTDKDMLGAVLDLDEVNVSQVMIHYSQMFSIDINIPVEDIIKLTIYSQHTRIPVWENNPDNIIGILHSRHLLKLFYEKGKLTIDDIKIILSTPWFIPKHTTLKTQLQQFRQQRNHLSIVVNEYGSMMGLITLEDILEEIVGDIEDELDNEQKHVTEISENIYAISASMTIRDLNRHFDLKISDLEANTVGGIIINNLERIPVVGDIITIENVKFKVLKIDNTRITKVEIEILK